MTLALTIFGLELSPQQWTLLALAVVFGFYMAWNIGANDLANAMGTSVGSGALTLRRAVLLALVLEVAGAVMAGSHVADTMRHSIVDLSSFKDTPLVLACGMLAALLAAGVWLQVATYFGLPVSTTHSIVGAIVGFGAAEGGLHLINWSVDNGGVGSIVASWVVSPLLAAAVAYLIFQAIRRHVLFSPDPVRAAQRFVPVLTFVVLAVMVLLLLYKGLKNLGVDKQPPAVNLGAALAVGLLGALVCHLWVRRLGTPQPDAPRRPNDYFVDITLKKAIKQLRRLEKASAGPVREQVAEMLEQAHTIQGAVSKDADLSVTNTHIRQVESIFCYLQILTAAFVAFAHGANDVANAIGPMSVVLQAAYELQVPQRAEVPTWALVLGGLGIAVGLATWGWRVIETVGKRITELSPSRGFSAEFATAVTVLGASKLGLPISTTHTLVGAVLGVGLARGITAINLNAVRDIAVSWVITVPAGALLTIAFFYSLKAIIV